MGKEERKGPRYGPWAVRSKLFVEDNGFSKRYFGNAMYVVIITVINELPILTAGDKAHFFVGNAESQDEFHFQVSGQAEEFCGFVFFHSTYHAGAKPGLTGGEIDGLSGYAHIHGGEVIHFFRAADDDIAAGALCIRSSLFRRESAAEYDQLVHGGPGLSIGHGDEAQYLRVAGRSGKAGEIDEFGQLFSGKRLASLETAAGTGFGDEFFQVHVVLVVKWFRLKSPMLSDNC